MKKHLYERLAALADGTRTRIECARIIGIEPRDLGGIVHRAQLNGLRLSFKARDPAEGTVWRRVAEFCKDGDKTRLEAAEHLGLTLSQVDGARSVAKRRGVAFEFRKDERKRSEFERNFDRGELRAGGGVAQLLRSLPAPISAWIVAQVPEGGTVADVIRGIVVDQYHDEQEAEGRVKSSVVLLVNA